ncbi:MAG: hypothetical protein WAV18_09660 [Roseiarcus sp.]
MAADPKAYFEADWSPSAAYSLGNITRRLSLETPRESSFGGVKLLSLLRWRISRDMLRKKQPETTRGAQGGSE